MQLNPRRVYLEVIIIIHRIEHHLPLLCLQILILIDCLMFRKSDLILEIKHLARMALFLLIDASWAKEM